MLKGKENTLSDKSITGKNRNKVLLLTFKIHAKTKLTAHSPSRQMCGQCYFFIKSRHFKRAGIKLIILFAEGNKLVMVSAFDYLSALKNNDVFRVADG